MIIDFMHKDPGSGSSGCPALYRADGGYVVQGVKIDDETRAQPRQLADNEDAVFVPSAVLDLLRQVA